MQGRTVLSPQPNNTHLSQSLLMYAVATEERGDHEIYYHHRRHHVSKSSSANFATIELQPGLTSVSSQRVLHS